MKVLSPESMKPSKLKRHLETKHTDCKDKDLLFFERKANCVKRSRMDSSGVFQQRNRASVEATFVISLRIAKAKKPHTIAEQLILPCAKDINRILIGKEAESKLNVLSLSDNTVQRRISLMSEDIKNQVIDQMKSAGSFALQLDESTDVSSCAQLIAFVRYVHKGAFKDEFLCIVDLPSTTRGEDIFKTIDAFFKANNIKWEQLCGLCTDGAPAMLGHSSGFHAHVKKVSPDCTFMHCMIHREALASKTLGPDLTEVLRQVIKLINTVKSSALNTRLFRRFCEQMDADQYNLLYYTKVRWLSKGNVLKRVFTLRFELRDFFVQQKKEDLVKFLHEDVVSLAYLVDIFGRLNELNLSLQGQAKTIINFIDALSAFQAKLELWERKMTKGQLGMFPTLNEFIEDTEDMRLDGDVKLKIINNLQSLRSEFTKYFPETTRDDLVFVRNPYLVPNSEVVNMFNGDVSTQEEFIALKNDSTAEDAFKEKSFPAYWSAMVDSYPRAASVAIRLLMPFPSTWLCEAGFSALLGIKNKARNKLIIEPDLRCALATTEPRIDELVTKMQHQSSHKCTCHVYKFN